MVQGFSGNFLFPGIFYTRARLRISISRVTVPRFWLALRDWLIFNLKMVELISACEMVITSWRREPPTEYPSKNTSQAINENGPVCQSLDDLFRFCISSRNFCLSRKIPVKIYHDFFLDFESKTAWKSFDTKYKFSTKVVAFFSISSTSKVSKVGFFKVKSRK